MPVTRNLNDVSVVEGKLIREVPSSRLDSIIARSTKRVASLNKRIEELVQERIKVQLQADRAQTLKNQLRA